MAASLRRATCPGVRRQQPVERRAHRLSPPPLLLKDARRPGEVRSRKRKLSRPRRAMSFFLPADCRQAERDQLEASLDPRKSHRGEQRQRPSQSEEPSQKLRLVQRCWSSGGPETIHRYHDGDRLESRPRRTLGISGSGFASYFLYLEPKKESRRSKKPRSGKPPIRRKHHPRVRTRCKRPGIANRN